MGKMTRPALASDGSWSLVVFVLTFSSRAFTKKDRSAALGTEVSSPPTAVGGVGASIVLRSVLCCFGPADFLIRFLSANVRPGVPCTVSQSPWGHVLRHPA
jgi:hypothetical protein